MTLRSRVQHIEHCAGVAEKDPREMTLLELYEACGIELERHPPNPELQGRLDVVAAQLGKAGALT